VGVTYQQVQRYENGKNKLNVENIQVIASALSVPVSYFFTADRPKGVSEPQIMYQTAEEQALLKDFRKIPEDAEKQLVLGVARLAAKK
jgi:transcriptional regulator with XRE-family HTH domain